MLRTARDGSFPFMAVLQAAVQAQGWRVEWHQTGPAARADAPQRDGYALFHAEAPTHDRALITAPNAVDLARKIIEKGLSVRETEELVRRQTAVKDTPAKRSPEKDADTRALEGDLSAHLKMRVAIKHAGQDGGQMVITYKNLDQLDRLCQVLAGH